MSTPYTEILTGHDLTVEEWDAMIAQEYLSMLWFRNLMGPSQFAPIQVKTDLLKGAGDAITIGLRSQLQGGRVDGSQKGAGQEGRVAFYGQRLTIEEVRHLVKFERVNMSQKRVAWDILNQGREALVEKAEIALEEDIIAALGVVTTGKVQGRYLYGAADSNYGGTHATDLQNIDNTDDKLTTNMIRIAKRKALIPVNATAKIRPMRVKVGMNFEEWFVFVGHPYSIRDLVDSDAAYRNAQLLIPPGSNSESPLFTGNAFRGSYDGVLIYEYDRIELIASTIQVSHNHFLGAQAAAVVWGQMPKFGEDHGEFDLGHDKVYEIDEIRGVEKIVYNRAADDAGITNEDNGQIHVFAAAVAD